MKNWGWRIKVAILYNPWSLVPGCPVNTKSADAQVPYIRAEYSRPSLLVGLATADSTNYRPNFMDVEGQLYSAFLHKGLEHPRILVAAGRCGTNSLQIPRDRCKMTEK